MTTFSFHLCSSSSLNAGHFFWFLLPVFQPLSIVSLFFFLYRNPFLLVCVCVSSFCQCTLNMMAKCRVSFSFSIFFGTFHIHPWWMSSKRLVESKEEENGQFFGLGDAFFPPYWYTLQPATGSDGHFFTFIVKPDRIHLLWFFFPGGMKIPVLFFFFLLLLSRVFCPAYWVVFPFLDNFIHPKNLSRSTAPFLLRRFCTFQSR